MTRTPNDILFIDDTKCLSEFARTDVLYQSIFPPPISPTREDFRHQLVLEGIRITEVGADVAVTAKCGNRESMPRARKADDSRTTRQYTCAVQLWEGREWVTHFESESIDEARAFLKERHMAYPTIARDDWRLVSVETTRIEMRML